MSAELSPARSMLAPAAHAKKMALPSGLPERAFSFFVIQQGECTRWSRLRLSFVPIGVGLDVGIETLRIDQPLPATVAWFS